MAVALAVTGGLAAYKIISGSVEKGKAKKEAAELKATRPKASANPELQSNLSVAESELTNNSALSNWKQLSDSDLSASIGAQLKSGGTPNDVGSVFANNEQGRLRMLQFGEQLRQQKIQNLSAAETAVANDQKSVFDYNSREWFDDKQANAMRAQQAKSEVDSGISDLGAGITNFATTKQYENQTQKNLAQQQQMYQEQQDNFMKQMNEYMNPTPITGGVRS